MKRIFPYYEMEATLRYGEKPWPDAPHVYLANMEVTEASVGNFTRIFGPLFGNLEERLAAMRPALEQYGIPTFAIPIPQPDLPVSVTQLAQDFLRRAWHGDEDALRVVAEGVPHGGSPSHTIGTGDDVEQRRLEAKGFVFPPNFHLFQLRLTEILTPPVTRLQIDGTGLYIFAADVWSFARLAFLRDHALGKIKICESPDCNTPYFLQSKKGQIYCGHRCAVLVNVRRFRNEKQNGKES